MKKRRPLCLPLLAAGVMFCAALLADSTVTMNDNTVVQVRNGMARLNPAEDSTYMQYDAARDVMIHVDPDAGTYMEIDQQSLQQQAGAMAAMQEKAAPQMEAMRAQLRHLPEAQRRIMEQQMDAMMGGAGASPPAAKPDVKVVKRDNRKVSGFTCNDYQVVEDKTPVADVCVAEAPGEGMSRKDFDTLSGMMAFVRSMAQQAGKMAGAMGAGLDAELLVDVKGFPVQMKNHRSGDEYGIASVSNDALSDEIFAGHRQLRRDELTGVPGR